MIVHQSALETYRRYISYDYISEADLIASVEGRGEVNWRMSAGKAWHSLLEASDYDLAGLDNIVEVGEWRFQLADVFDARRAMPQGGVREVPVYTPFVVDGQSVTLACTLDHLVGTEICDSKAKFTTPDARDYESSLQWRCYLLATGATRFTYFLWDFPSKPDKNGLLVLQDLLTVPFFPYCSMAEDVERWLAEFCRWARARKITPRFSRAA